MHVGLHSLHVHVPIPVEYLDKSATAVFFLHILALHTLRFTIKRCVESLGMIRRVDSVTYYAYAMKFYIHSHIVCCEVRVRVRVHGN